MTEPETPDTGENTAEDTAEGAAPDTSGATPEALRAQALHDLTTGRTTTAVARAAAAALTAISLDVAAIRAQGERQVQVQQTAAKATTRLARKRR